MISLYFGQLKRNMSCTITPADEDGDAKSASPDCYQSDSDEEDDLDGAEQPIR